MAYFLEYRRVPDGYAGSMVCVRNVLFWLLTDTVSRTGTLIASEAPRFAPFFVGPSVPQ